MEELTFRIVVMLFRVSYVSRHTMIIHQPIAPLDVIQVRSTGGPAYSLDAPSSSSVSSEPQQLTHLCFHILDTEQSKELRCTIAYIGSHSVLDHIEEGVNVEATLSQDGTRLDAISIIR